ncbi:hypothetical protein B0H14DRAFT_3491542 [Mycena olivaceomarginata]|nr:hypothetical protein B0H14DRAFT_3491542 [Mycena olivaceomarginata]
MVVEAQATMLRNGRSSKRKIAENGFETDTSTASDRAHDLLTLLVPANTSKDLPASQRLSDEDIIAHLRDVAVEMPTFLVAGHSAFFPPLSTYLPRNDKHGSNMDLVRSHP